MNKEFNDKPKSKSLFTSVIPTNVYGRHDNFNLDQAHVIPSLIHKAYLAIEQSTHSVLKVCGSGKPLRQFIYAPDLAELILWTLEKYESPDPIILAPDPCEEISISQVAQYIVEAFLLKTGQCPKLIFDTSFSDGQFKKTASNQKLRSYLPNFKFTPVDIGIKETVDWFCDNFATARK